MLAPAQVNKDVQALVSPPKGWQVEPLKQSENHRHQVWLSPTGRTAYGVIFIRLPLPVGQELALWGFMREMRRSEGEANLISKQWDPNLSATRFVAEGGLYRVRVNLFVDGWSAWAVYAGLGYQVNEKLTLEAAYRYISLGNAVTGDLIAYDGTNTIVNPMHFNNLTSNDFKLGFRYSLN